jgi:peroxiredoxin
LLRVPFRATQGIVLALALLSGCGGAKAPAGGPTALAPDFTLADLNGRSVSLRDFRGRVVLLDFWATWCPPCNRELPDLVRLHDRHRREGFTVVGVTMEEPASDVLKVVKREKIRYPVLAAGTETPGYDFDTIPTAYLIDCKGFVVKKYKGMKEPGELEGDVQEALADCGHPARPPAPAIPILAPSRLFGQIQADTTGYVQIAYDPEHLALGGPVEDPEAP